MRSSRLLVTVVLWASLATAQSGSKLAAGDNFVVCVDSLDSGRCSFSVAAVKLSLEHLKPAISGWRFVIGDSSRWAQMCKNLGVSKCTPAFSMVGLRTTYLTSTLTFWDGRIHEDLQRYTNLTGQERLEWVLAHELGHILCQTGKESDAERAGGRLRYSPKHDTGCRVD